LGQDNLNLVPAPAELKVEKGVFKIANKFGVVYAHAQQAGEEAYRISKYFKQEILKRNFDCSLIGYETKGRPAQGLFYILFDNSFKKGEYHLTVTSSFISLTGDEEGLFYGIQTLLQIIESSNNKPQTINHKLIIPQLTINDYPRFPYRGMHFDVCRHFFPVSFVKKYIDYLAAYKFNTFHWHLTDDQGWRIQIKKYPELTTVGAKRNGTIIDRYPGKGSDNKPYGGFYTQEEIKEVVQYAKERYIDVIPEIEMPGHSSAAIAAYPWLSCFPAKPTEIPAKMISQKSMDEQKAGRIKLVQETWGVFDDVFCAGKDSTFSFLENVIDEVAKLFPSKYIHIGGDESPKTHWKICPACQKRIKDNNLKDEHELQSYFIQHIEKYVNSKGKTIIGWDEILEGGLAPNAVVMSWRGEKGGIEAAKQKHQVIMTPGNPVYFDHTQSKNEDSVTIGGYNPIENVYAYEPIPKELNAEEGKYILGAQANMWAEYFENSSKVEYMLFPRITALSEVLWSPKEKRDWKDFERRLPVIFERLDKQKINYSKAYYDLKTTVIPTENFDGVLWKVETNQKEQVIKINYWNAHDIMKIHKDSLVNGKEMWVLVPVYVKHDLVYSSPLKIDIHGFYESFAIEKKGKKSVQIGNSIKQEFLFNKATGKKITLATEASKNYPGDGAFTLVNGVQNEKGISKSSEFLGFLGKDLEAIIDLGKPEEINSVRLHVLEQRGSWIYPPSNFEVYTSDDGINFKMIGNADAPKVIPGEPIKLLEAGFAPLRTRYVKVFAKNFGVIPSGNPGAGNPAWLFVDEIEVQ
jgi:hexosaminidase